VRLEVPTSSQSRRRTGDPVRRFALRTEARANRTGLPSAAGVNTRASSSSDRVPLVPSGESPRARCTIQTIVGPGIGDIIARFGPDDHLRL
jgi:hypothetical protein